MAQSAFPQSEKPTTRPWWKPTKLNKALTALWCGALLRKGPLCCTTNCSCFNDVENPEAQRARAEEARWKYRSEQLAHRKETREQAAERRSARQAAKHERKLAKDARKSARRSKSGHSSDTKEEKLSTVPVAPAQPQTDNTPGATTPKVSSPAQQPESLNETHTEQATPLSTTKDASVQDGPQISASPPLTDERQPTTAPKAAASAAHKASVREAKQRRREKRQQAKESRKSARREEKAKKEKKAD